MVMADFTPTQVGSALANIGNYRVRRAQVVALEGEPDGISGSLLLALGLRETYLKNIEGGAKFVDGKWVKQDDPSLMDVGVFQINRHYHQFQLESMPGVASGSWGPIVPGKTAGVAGYVPRYEDSLKFTLNEFHDAIPFGIDNGVKSGDLVRFAVAAHNAGPTGALRGYKAGDVDKYTTLGDYSAFVLRHRTLINEWIGKHKAWKV